MQNHHYYKEEIFFTEDSGILLEEHQKGIMDALISNIAVGVIGGFYEEGYPIYFISRFALNNIGYSFEEFMEQTNGYYQEAIVPRDYPIFLHNRQENPEKYKEYRLRHKDGRGVWVHETCRDSAAADGRKIWICTVRLIDSEYRSNQLNRQAFHMLQDSFFRISAIDLLQNSIINMKLIESEIEEEAVCEGDYQKVIANCGKNHVALEDQDKFIGVLSAENLLSVFADSKEPISMNYHRLVNGVLTWVRSEIVPVDNFDVHPAVMWYVRNISEEKAREAEYTDRLLKMNAELIHTKEHLEEANRRVQEANDNLQEAYETANRASNAKTEFLSKMSHDIRTPMNAILGMIAVAEMHIDEKERVLDSLHKITVSGKHLLGLINEILDMSKIESGKVSLTEDCFNLSDMIKNLFTVFHSQMAAKNLEYAVSIAHLEHENVLGDEQRLQQIFMNIMGNAIKFTPEGGKISVSIAEKESEVSGSGCYEFVFTDTGIGMEQEYVDKIFEPFSRAKDSRIDKIEGTGLGMSIAVNIARMMNGDIKVESTPGKGSKFSVSVYLKLDDIKPEDIEAFAKLPILVVDDDEDACASACEMLDSLSMKAEYVMSGERAVERVLEAKDEEAFAVVILDWKMPGKDGLETAKEIRQKAAGDVPIVILSAYDWSDIKQEALAAGVNAFIEKPLFKSRLTHVLKHVLGLAKEKRQGSKLETFQEQDFSGRRVLLVEDNELNIEVASELLDVVGIQVETALNGKEAVERVQNAPSDYYDMIFMDIQMPLMNGYEAATAIRALGRSDLSSVPIIAMTADAFEDDIKRCHAAGMNGHISKPVDIANLERVLREWIV